MIVFDISGFEVIDKFITETVLKIDNAVPIALGKIAEDVRFDIQRNLGNVTSFDGSTIAPLRESTIKQKGHAVAFVKSGKLLKSVKKQKIDKQTWEVFIAPDRAAIMYYLQKGDKPLAGARRAFGLSQRAIDNSHRRMLDMKIG